MSVETPPKERFKLRGLWPHFRKWVAIAVGVSFWGWLVARWVNNWVLLPLGFGVSADTPFFSSDFFHRTASSLNSISQTLNPVFGYLTLKLGQFFGLVGFAIDFFPALAIGAWLTIVLTVSSILVGLLVAVPLTVARVYGRRTKWVALIYIELIRGTPLLAQLFFLYYGLPFLSRWLREVPFVGQGYVPNQAVWIAILGFIINSSAYQAEYLRGAFESVDPGQLTAARSIGLSKLEGIRHVVIPQALRYGIPAWTNELVYLIKYSSLAGFITVPEIYYRATTIVSQNFKYPEMYTLIALLYIGLVISATKIMSRVEKRVAIPGIGQIETREA